MTAKNHAREQMAYLMLTISVVLLLLGWFANPGWSFFLSLVGGTLFVVSLIMIASLSIINGVPWFVRQMSLHAEPVWNGEILHTDGGGHKLRYLLDVHGEAYFVAYDICIAVGTNPPLKDAKKWGGFLLFTYGENLFFSESSVQEFLMPLAHKSHDANRLLILIRKNVLNKLNKQRDQNRQYGETPDS
jgi:hypothetical protein